MKSRRQMMFVRLVARVGGADASSRSRSGYSLILDLSLASWVCIVLYVALALYAVSPGLSERIVAAVAFAPATHNWRRSSDSMTSCHHVYEDEYETQFDTRMTRRRLAAPTTAASRVGLKLVPLRGCSSIGRALRSQCRGSGFESHHLHEVTYVPFGGPLSHRDNFALIRKASNDASSSACTISWCRAMATAPVSGKVSSTHSVTRILPISSPGRGRPRTGSIEPIRGNVRSRRLLHSRLHPEHRCRNNGPQ